MAKRSRPTPAADARPRLQKILAMAGFGSRRQCEDLITTGRVEIDRQVVTELGCRVDPETQQVRVDGEAVKLPRFKYFMLHKPVNVISTAKDPWARTRVIDLVESTDRLFTVGRLDLSSSGLILVTNDGDLAHRLTHPSFRVEKVYGVVVAGNPTAETLQQLRSGVYLAEGKARVERVSVRRRSETSCELEIVLSEGRNREIRRLLSRFGHKVQRLKRVALGPIRLGELPVGAYRELTPREVQSLRRVAAGLPNAADAKPKAASQGDRTTSSKQRSPVRSNRGGGQRASTTRGSDRSSTARGNKIGPGKRLVPQLETARRDWPKTSSRSAGASFGTVLGSDFEPVTDGADSDAPRRSGKGRGTTDATTRRVGKVEGRAARPKHGSRRPAGRPAGSKGAKAKQRRSGKTRGR